MSQQPALPGQGEENPPVGGSWPRLYAVVLGTLLALVVLFYLFSRGFA